MSCKSARFVIAHRFCIGCSLHSELGIRKIPAEIRELQLLPEQAVCNSHAKGNNGQLKAALYTIFSIKTETQEVDDRLSTAIVALGVAMQQAIIDERNAERDRIWPVGKGRHTTYDGLNPAHASHLNFGTWILDTAAAGRVDVGAGAITIDYSAAIDDAARGVVLTVWGGLHCPLLFLVQNRP